MAVAKVDFIRKNSTKERSPPRNTQFPMTPQINLLACYACTAS